MNRKHYRFTYENNGDFVPFPTNAATLCHGGPFLDGDFSAPGLPQFNPMMLLHGEEHIVWHKPLVTGVKYKIQESIPDVSDKKSGASIGLQAIITDDETGDHYATVRSSLFIRGLGGFGYKGKKKTKLPKPPARPADFTGESKVEENAAFFYRLNSDTNPLHVDPDMAEMGGFKRPILHGLCTLGFTARIVQQQFFPEDPYKMEEFASRFTSHVFPGETLVVDCWKEGEIIIFQTRTKERGKNALVGFLRLKP